MKKHRRTVSRIRWALFVGLVAAALVTSVAVEARAARHAQPATDPAVAALRDQALQSDAAWKLLASLTTEVGPRSAGSAGDKRAVEWALAAMKGLGLDDVRSEPVVVPHWVRGENSGEILAPFPQKVLLTALGGSVGTSEEGITAEVVGFPTLEALQAAPDDQVRGRIVYLDRRMERTKDERGYGEGVGIRRDGPATGGKKGALAVLIRSVATGNHRFPHTGTTFYGEAPKVPAAALAVPDADVLAAQLASGKPVRFHLKLTSRVLADEPSANVIGEVRGATHSDEIVLLGAHLDSWDLGTGAIDDGAGCAIVMAAAKLIAAQPRRPARTIRIVLYANEEAGLSGARAYAKEHADELPKHVLALEADLGAGKVWGLRALAAPAGRTFLQEVARDLAPLGIDWLEPAAFGGADLSPLEPAHVPLADLAQDASEYFDYHHTADDTLDKVDPKSLAQVVAAYAVTAWRVADSTVAFGPAPPPPPRR
ncbi:MAG TPA: M20/M25/M40 family metallo-hydrolase [Thermoanaerobaculia bacterium]|nr:M20/M25/M40 family metallo-hydrolase [Thermoanaerobaculia bacterium]